MRRLLVERGFGDWVLLAFLASEVAALPLDISRSIGSQVEFASLVLVAGFLYTVSAAATLLFTPVRYEFARSLGWGFLCGGAILRALAEGDFPQPGTILFWGVVAVGAWVQSWRAACGLEERGRRG